MRCAFGAATLIAVAIQLGIHIGNGFSMLNFFSYFTNLSNIFAGRALVVEATLTWRGKAAGPLRDLLPWINTWLHSVMPVAVAVVWLIQPPRNAIALHWLGIAVAFPLVYRAYSLIRGAAINWHAYPFLNPANGGYGAVLASWLIIVPGNRLRALRGSVPAAR